ncbi:uncharacterized protein [Venturia canescens]|uniref:uncharacterized protein n=1 Tax=Venturia canescens TaxID=32260 RepID=UPI001C9BEF3E|nr:uncharacterized protein LOC122419190 [Venturia canescens]
MFPSSLLLKCPTQFSFRICRSLVHISLCLDYELTLTKDIEPSARVIDTVAGYRRRRLLVEEVPGLYIRRLTLEDPRNAAREKEPTDSRSPSPSHICHPKSAHDRPGRGSSSYRSWLEKVRNERPAYLTITSLELPECPIPLIESQASARARGSEESPRSNPERDTVLDEFLEKVSRIGRDKDKDPSGTRSFRTTDYAKRTSTRNRGSRTQFSENECSAGLGSLEECTKSIVAGPTRYKMRPSTSDSQVFKDCICSEISENLRVNIREKTEVIRGGSRSPSPEVTHTIRIAMKYHGQSAECRTEGSGDYTSARKRHGDGEEPENIGKDKQYSGAKNSRIREDSCCPGVNLALDFTLNCTSVQLTSRDISLKSGTNTVTNQQSDED